MILITGATGTIGKRLVQGLVEAGQPVRVFSRDERKLAHLDPHIERTIGDLSQPETLAPALEGIEKLFLVTMDFGLQQDTNAVEAAKRAGVRHIVKLSTLEATDHVLQVGKWHYEREQLIRVSGLDWTFLRPGMFMTNIIEWFAGSIRQQGTVYFPGGKGKVAPVDPADVARVAAVALTQEGHTGKAYELTGPELLTIGEQVQIISRLVGKPLKYVDIPPVVARFWMLQSGLDKRLVGAMIELVGALRKNKAAALTDTVERVTGSPARSFEAWCRENVEAFR